MLERFRVFLNMVCLECAFRMNGHMSLSLVVYVISLRLSLQAAQSSHGVDGGGGDVSERHHLERAKLWLPTVLGKRNVAWLAGWLSPAAAAPRARRSICARTHYHHTRCGYHTALCYTPPPRCLYPLPRIVACGRRRMRNEAKLNMK